MPALNFAILFQAPEAEVKDVGPLLVTTERARQIAEEGRSHRDALLLSRDRAAAEIQRTAERVAFLAARLPALQAEAAVTAEEEQSLITFVAQQEHALLTEAQDLAAPKVSFLKQALRVVGAIATVLPVGQPVVGAIGAGLTVLSSIDEHTPWEPPRDSLAPPRPARRQRWLHVHRSLRVTITTAHWRRESAPHAWPLPGLRAPDSGTQSGALAG